MQARVPIFWDAEKPNQNERVNCTDKLDSVNGDNMFRFNAYSVMVMPECQNKLDGMTFEKEKKMKIFIYLFRL